MLDLSYPAPLTKIIMSRNSVAIERFVFFAHGGPFFAVYESRCGSWRGCLLRRYNIHLRRTSICYGSYGGYIYLSKLPDLPTNIGRLANHRWQARQPPLAGMPTNIDWHTIPGT